MKKFRKLIPALCMLLISAMLMGTSTYAWFSMNTTVTATGMQVTAKSNAVFLLIGDDADKAAASTKLNASGSALTTSIGAKYTTTGNDDKQCYPTAYYADAGTLNGHATTADKWYTTSSDRQDQAVSGTGAITEVTEGDKNYMLTYKVWLTLSKDSEDVNKPIKVTYSKTSGDDAISAVVKIGTEKLVVNSVSTTATTTSNVALTADTAVEVIIFIYCDGNSTNVNSQYIQTQTLTGIVGVQFDIVES